MRSDSQGKPHQESEAHNDARRNTKIPCSSHTRCCGAARIFNQNIVCLHRASSTNKEFFDIITLSLLSAAFKNDQVIFGTDYLNIYEEEIDLREIKGGEQYGKDIHEIRALLDKYI